MCSILVGIIAAYPLKAKHQLLSQRCKLRNHSVCCVFLIGAYPTVSVSVVRCRHNEMSRYHLRPDAASSFNLQGLHRLGDSTCSRRAHKE